MRKPVFKVSDQIQPKSGFTSTEVEGYYFLCNENKGTDQLHSYCAADLCLCFHICKKQVFSCSEKGGS